MTDASTAAADIIEATARTSAALIRARIDNDEE